MAKLNRVVGVVCLVILMIGSAFATKTQLSQQTVKPMGVSLINKKPTSVPVEQSNLTTATPAYQFSATTILPIKESRYMPTGTPVQQSGEKTITTIKEFKITAATNDKQSSITSTTTASPEAQQEARSIKPILPAINLEKKDKSKFDVHVPIVFDMTKDIDARTGQTKTDLSVLKGLVTVTHERPRFWGGLREVAPLTVTVLGFPVYTKSKIAYSNDDMRGSAQSLSVIQTKLSGPNFDHKGITASSFNTPSTVELYSPNARDTNKNILTTISDVLSKAETWVRQAKPLLFSANGKSADNMKSKYVKPSNFTKTDMEPKVPRILVDKNETIHESLDKRIMDHVAYV